jgi:thiol-disulfide isomerase/thioredoxin
MADRSKRRRDGRSTGPDTSTNLQRGRWLALVGILAVGAVVAGVVALELDQSEPTGTGHDATAVADAAAGGAATPAPDAAAESEGAFPIVVYRGADTLGAEELDFGQLLGTGTPVVLNFWAGQCPPCRAEMPDFQAVYDRYADEFLLVGVDIGPFIGLGTRESAIELGVASLGLAAADVATRRTHPQAGAAAALLAARGCRSSHGARQVIARRPRAQE